MTSLRAILRSERASLVPATMGSLAVHAVGLSSLLWVTFLSGLLAAVFPFCHDQEPLVKDAIEVSMVALPKSQRNVPDRLARTPRATGAEAPMEEPPPIKTSDVVIQLPDAPKQAGNTEQALREQMLTEMERQKLLDDLVDAPEGTVDRNRTDPNGQADLDLAVLLAGAPGDPAFVKWQEDVRRVLMPHFRPLTMGRTDLECIVSIEMEPGTGRITSWKVAQSSGDPSYDAAAERAVEDAAALPLPPEKYLPLLEGGVGFRFTPP
jgi:TonB family protein